MNVSTAEAARPAVEDRLPSASAAPQPQQKNRKRGIVAFVVHHVPTVFVMAGLAAVGAYGHSTHWKIPQFSELTGAAPPAAADWCEDHGVPESQCVECNPDRFPNGPDHGWCVEHGVHNCPLHHPGAAQLKKPPAVSGADLNRAVHALALRHRRDNNAACTNYQRRIQFASIEAVQQAGVDVELVDRQRVSERVAANGEITYDATRLASLSSPVAGTVWRVLKNIGDPVREEDILAVVDAMEVGRLKGELVKALVAEDLARKNVNRLSGITSGAIPGRQLLETEAALAQAEVEVLSAQQALANLGLRADLSVLKSLPSGEVLNSLRFLGLPRDVVIQFEAQTATANLIPIRSPMDGIVVERNIVAGEVIDPTRALFQVADPSRMWLMLNIPQEEAALISVGQSVRFRPNTALAEVTGQLTWISTAADRQTRMVKARAELENRGGKLRDETFGTGQIILREEPQAIVVPRSAVHWEGCCQIVFVRNRDYFAGPTSPKVFHVRTVRTGTTNGDMTEIIAGLLPGEVVVTKGSDVLRAQLLRNSLGAGCCAE